MKVKNAVNQITEDVVKVLRSEVAKLHIENETLKTEICKLKTYISTLNVNAAVVKTPSKNVLSKKPETIKQDKPIRKLEMSTWKENPTLMYLKIINLGLTTNKQEICNDL